MSPFLVGARRYELETRAIVVGIIEERDPTRAVREAQRLLTEGADLLHVASPATTTARGSEPDADREVVALVTAVRALGVGVAVRVASPSAFAAACEAGADFGLAPRGVDDRDYLGVAARARASVLVSRPLGEPSRDVGRLVAALRARARRAEAAGVEPDRIAVDPIGPDADPSAALEVLCGGARLVAGGYPMAIAAGSRPPAVTVRAGGSTLPPDVRRARELAVIAYGVAHGARIVFSRDVGGATRVCRMVEAMLAEAKPRPTG